MIGTLKYTKEILVGCTGTTPLLPHLQRFSPAKTCTINYFYHDSHYSCIMCIKHRYYNKNNLRLKLQLTRILHLDCSNISSCQIQFFSSWSFPFIHGICYLTKMFGDTIMSNIYFFIPFIATLLLKSIK